MLLTLISDDFMHALFYLLCRNVANHKPFSLKGNFYLYTLYTEFSFLHNIQEILIFTC